MPKWLIIFTLLILLWAGAIYYGNSQKGPVVISQVNYDSPSISFLAQNTTDRSLIAGLLITNGGVTGRMQSSSMAVSQTEITLNPHEKKLFTREFLKQGIGFPEVTVISVENN